MDKIIKIYSDRSKLPESMPHVGMLYPFWGKNPENPEDPWRGIYDEYEKIGRFFYKMTSIDEADFAVLPVSWEFVVENEKLHDFAIDFAEDAEKKNKKILIFYWSDRDDDVPIDNAIIFRTSLYRSNKKSNEHAMPSWTEDFVERYFNGIFPLNKKGKKPKVGFCGRCGPFNLPIPTRLKKKVRWFASLAIPKSRMKYKYMLHTGDTIRSMCLSELIRSKIIENKFIIKDTFRGTDWLPDGGGYDFKTAQRARMEYVQNIAESDYIFCCRGAGNYSYRLYETMCGSRIPLFVDTDCVLPYDFEIDWKEFCIWVDEKDIGKLEEKVKSFHDGLSDQEFIELQMKGRKVWEEYISPVGFFKNLYKHFQ